MQQNDLDLMQDLKDGQFLKEIIFSAKLAIKIDQIVYTPTEGPGGAGHVKPLAGAEPLIHYIATCDQFPDLKFSHASLNIVKARVFQRIAMIERFCVVVDGIEIFGSARALKAHGFFEGEEDLAVPTGKYDGSAYIRMVPLEKPNGRTPIPYYRFYARSGETLPDVYKILKARAEVKEVCFNPSHFERIMVA